MLPAVLSPSGSELGPCTGGSETRGADGWEATSSAAAFPARGSHAAKEDEAKASGNVLICWGQVGQCQTPQLPRAVDHDASKSLQACMHPALGARQGVDVAEALQTRGLGLPALKQQLPLDVSWGKMRLVLAHIQRTWHMDSIVCS